MPGLLPAQAQGGRRRRSHDRDLTDGGGFRGSFPASRSSWGSGWRSWCVRYWFFYTSSTFPNPFSAFRGVLSGRWCETHWSFMRTTALLKSRVRQSSTTSYFVARSFRMVSRSLQVFMPRWLSWYEPKVRVSTITARDSSPCWKSSTQHRSPRRSQCEKQVFKAKTRHGTSGKTR